jgi:hypothetical protein
MGNANLIRPGEELLHSMIAGNAADKIKTASAKLIRGHGVESLKVSLAHPHSRLSA